MLTIPSKTFLLGEYAALQGYPAILLTTKPYFTATVAPDLLGVHPDSPAGKLAKDAGTYIHFTDPYQGLGGLGASSAQFLSVYHFTCELLNQEFTLKGLMATYLQYAYPQMGIKPSAYDLLAQTSRQCVYIKDGEVKSFTWPFPSLTFILIHTKIKCATHVHLQSLLSLPDNLSELGSIVEFAWQACLSSCEINWIHAIQAYYEALLANKWVSETSLEYLAKLKIYPGVKAVKGCGAMGSDVLFILLEREALASCLHQLKIDGHYILATEEDLFCFF